jgi:hypothetical protein
MVDELFNIGIIFKYTIKYMESFNALTQQATSAASTMTQSSMSFLTELTNIAKNISNLQGEQQKNMI